MLSAKLLIILGLLIGWSLGTVTNENADFDDVETPPAGVTNTQALGEYMSLNYTNFIAGTLAPNAAVAPKSSPVVLNHGDLAAVEGGDVSNPGVITVASGVKSFSPKKLYFGCQGGAAEGTVTLPDSCTVLFTGKRSGSSRKIQKKAKFTTGLLDLAHPLKLVKFGKKWSSIRSLSITVLEADLTAEVTELVIDSFSYSVDRK